MNNLPLRKLLPKKGISDSDDIQIVGEVTPSQMSVSDTSRISDNIDEFTSSQLNEPPRKLYAIKRKNPRQVSEQTPISGGETVPHIADDPVLEGIDLKLKHTVKPFSAKISQFGKISYLDDDTITYDNKPYDPEQDRSFHCFNYEEPKIIISNIRSLKRKVPTGQKDQIKPSRSSAAKAIVPKRSNEPDVVVIPYLTTRTTTTTSTTATTTTAKTSTAINAMTTKTIATTTATKKPMVRLIRKNMPSLLPATASKASDLNLPLIVKNPVVQDPNVKHPLQVIRNASGEVQCTSKLTEDAEIMKNNSINNVVSLPAVPLPLTQSAVTQDNTGHLANCINTVQKPVPSGNQPMNTKCMKIINRGEAMQKENPAASGKQPVVLKRLRIVNPSNVKVDIQEIIRHIETVGLKPGKTVIRTVSKPTSSPSKSSATPKNKLILDDSSSALVDTGPCPINLETSDDTTVVTTNAPKTPVFRLISKNMPSVSPASDLNLASSTSHTGGVESVKGTEFMKKRVNSQVLVSAIARVKSRKKGRTPVPSKLREPEFEPGSENLSFLYLKVEDPYPDEHGNLVEPSMSLIERSLNTDSMKAEDTTTWTTKTLDPLGLGGKKASKVVNSSQTSEKRDGNEEANEPVPEREPSPDIFEDHTYHSRPATPESTHEESEESANEAEEENCPEEDVLGKVYTEARRFLEKPKKSVFLPPPIDPEDAESVIEYLTKKLEICQKENKSLERELFKSRKMIKRMRDEVFQYKLARGFKAKKNTKIKKKTDNRTILEKSMGNLDLDLFN